MEPRVSDASHPDPAPILNRTPLYALHVARGARIVPYAGYEMPVQYPLGVLKEHLHTRAAAGLFDVSHMGQIVVRPRSGQIADAALALERLVPADLLNLKPGRQCYSFFTNGTGGILDDLMIAHRGDHVLLVVNSNCKAEDATHLAANLSGTCEVEPLDRALIALQGPKAETALARLAPACASMHFMDVRDIDILGVPCVVTRSGYTGEDGFEISIPADHASAIAAALLEDPNVQPIGLGARDSLRLEAGLCLYGADLDETTTPVEAGIAWAVPRTRRAEGEHPAEFPGARIILDQIARGPERCRVGLLPEGRAPVRAGADLYPTEDSQRAVGTVTSGGFGPTLDRPVAMGYVPSSLAATGTRIFAEIRGKRLPMTVTPLPFVATRFKRGPSRQP